MRIKLEQWLLILLSIFLIMTHKFWLSVDSRPPSWDASAHLNLCLQYQDGLTHPGSGIVKNIVSVSGYYPPLYHLSALPFLKVFGFSLASASLVNLFYLLILIWATYGIGKRLYNDLTGLLAALFVSVYPYLSYMTNSFLTDLALTSMVTLGMYLYLRSENFTKTWPSILFGLVCGIGVLVKWTYGFFLVGPVIYSIWQVIKTRKDHIGALRNFGISLFIAFVVALPWYSYNLIKFVRYSIRFSGIGANEGDPVLLSLSSWLYYSKNLLLQIQPVFLVLFVIGLLVYLRTWRRQNKVLFWWLVIPYVILSLIRNKDERYTLPLLAAVSIISCFWLVNIRREVFKYVLVSLVVVFGVTQYFVTSFGQAGYYYCQPPHQEAWQQKEVCDLLLQLKPPQRQYTAVSVVANQSYWHSESLQCYAEAHQLPILFKGYSKNLGQFADFVITKNGDLGPEFSVGQMPEAREAILNPYGEFHRNFQLAGIFALPDNSWLYVYKREAKAIAFEPRKFDAGVLGEKLAKGMGEYFRDAEELDIQVEIKNMEDALLGKVEKLIISARKLKLGNIWLSNVMIIIKGLEIDLPLLWDKEKLIVYNIDEVQPAFALTVQDLQGLLRDKARNLQDPLVSIQHNVLNLEGDFKGLHLRVKAGIVKEKDEMYVQCTKFKIGWLRIPRWFYQSIVEKAFKLSPTPEWPVKTVVNEITLQDDKIIVN
jgi:4-amino-4-deoxy-L-arabinose transferase-like glycosyltransferase